VASNAFEVIAEFFFLGMQLTQVHTTRGVRAHSSWYFLVQAKNLQKRQKDFASVV
jgi:hypothetical protein